MLFSPKVNNLFSIVNADHPPNRPSIADNSVTPDGASARARTPDQPNVKGEEFRIPNEPLAKTAPDYGVAVVERTLDVLEVLARGASTLTRIAADVGCTNTAAFRLLHTLSARGLAVQDSARGPWRLGGWMVERPHLAVPRNPLAAFAAPFLTVLARTQGATVSLTQRVGFHYEVVAMCHADEAHAAPRERGLGSFGPLHAGGGRLLLAYAGEDTQAAILSQRLQRYTMATITEPRRLGADLLYLKTVGWLIADNELAQGQTTIAAVVRDPTGSANTAVSISGERAQLAPARALVEKVRECAEQIASTWAWPDVKATTPDQSGDTPHDLIAVRERETNEPGLPIAR